MGAADGGAVWNRPLPFDRSFQRRLESTAPSEGTFVPACGSRNSEYKVQGIRRTERHPLPMKTLRVSATLFLLMGGLLNGQDGVAPVPVVPGAVYPAPGAPLRTAAKLEQLLAPIALYPDALIAIILPASTAPTDIVLAARHLRDFPADRSQIEHRAWDESVKSLANYPDVVKWLDENLTWTKQVGEAFTSQPADVMQTIQRLRTKAQAAGTLVTTPQQEVIAEQSVIRIVPAQPNVIYVPYYQPEVVFIDRPVYYPQPFLTFGAGVAVGSWLAFDCDWRGNSIWVGDRHRRWSGHDWRRPVVPFASTTIIVQNGYARPPAVRQWRPPPQPMRGSAVVTWHSPREIVRPAPIASLSTRTYSYAPRPRLDGHRDGSTTTTPIAPLPRNFAPVNRADLAGPRAPATATTRVVPSSTAAYSASAPIEPIVAIPAPVPPTNVNRRGNGNSGNGNGNGEPSREHEYRGRRYQAPVGPTAPAATPPPAPAFASPPASANASPATTTSRPHYRPAPPPSANPAIAPLPMAQGQGRSRGQTPMPAAAASAPAPAPAASAPAPAPAPQSPREEPRSDRRGGRRENER